MPQKGLQDDSRTSKAKSFHPMFDIVEKVATIVLLCRFRMVNVEPPEYLRACPDPMPPHKPT